MTEYEDVDDADGAPASAVAANGFDEVALRLSSLQRHEYDQIRKTEADNLGVRVSTLDAEVERIRHAAGSGDDQSTGKGRALKLPEPTPWDTEVDGGQLLDAITGEFLRYLALTKWCAEAMALWVLHTHLVDTSYITPRLVFTSPLPRCGKSRALSVMHRMVPRPLLAANVTPAVVYRAVEAAQPTLLFDEMDTFLNNGDELTGILNSGHCVDTASVIRTVGDDFEPRSFNTFAALALAKIGKLEGALGDRSIEIPMRRRRPDEQIARFRQDQTGHLKILGRKAARWAQDNREWLSKADPSVPDSLHDRAGDNWRPLITLADRAGGEWPARARAAALALTTTTEDDLMRVDLLADIREIFAARSTDKIPSAELCSALADIEEGPWVAFGRQGKPIKPTQLAKHLRAFGIKSKTIRITLANTAKGYEVKSFTDAFSRYLPPLTAVTPSQSRETAGLRPNGGVTSEANVTGEKRLEAVESLNCYAVTAPQGDSQGEDIERAAIRQFDGQSSGDAQR